MDSNHDKQYQKLLCYRYTTGQLSCRCVPRNRTVSFTLPATHRTYQRVPRLPTGMGNMVRGNGGVSIGAGRGGGWDGKERSPRACARGPRWEGKKMLGLGGRHGGESVGRVWYSRKMAECGGARVEGERG